MDWRCTKICYRAQNKLSMKKLPGFVDLLKPRVPYFFLLETVYLASSILLVSGPSDHADSVVKI